MPLELLPFLENLGGKVREDTPKLIPEDIHRDVVSQKSYDRVNVTDRCASHGRRYVQSLSGIQGKISRLTERAFRVSFRRPRRFLYVECS